MGNGRRSFVSEVLVKRHRRHSLLAALVLAGAAAGAQPAGKVLSLQDCLRLARQAQSSLTIARQQVEIARLAVSQVRAGFLPQSHLGNNFIYNSPLLHDRTTFSFIPLNAIREYSSLLTTTLELDSSGRLRAELARARAGQKVAEAEARLSERDLKRAVTAAYFRALLARHVLEATGDSLAEAQEFRRRAELLFEKGEAARADMVKAAAAVALLEQSRQQAELEARLAMQELASFWTTEVDQPIQLEDPLSEPPPAPEDAQPGKPFLKRPEFLVIEAQQRAAQADARRARSDLLPQFSLAFQYGLDSWRVRWADRGYAAFLTLNVPVFDWLRARNAERQAQWRSRQLEAERAAAERTFARDYQAALARVRQIYSQIAVARSQVQLCEESLRLSRLRYEGGEGSALDVVTAQAQLTQARTNYYATLAGYWNARADLEVASGR